MDLEAYGKEPNQLADERKSLLEIHSATLLFGLAGMFGKWISLSSLMIVLGRVFFASLSLGMLLLATKQSFRHIAKRDFLLLGGLGLILAFHWTFFFKSIQVSTVAIGLLSYSSFPAFTVFLEPLFFRERVNGSNILLACLCLFGVFLIIPRLAWTDSVVQGVAWGLMAGVTFAVLTVFNRKLSPRYSSLLIAFFQDSWAVLFLLPFYFFSRIEVNVRNLALLMILGVICTATAHSLFIRGMRRIKAQTASIISTLEPVYGIVLAFVFLRESPSLRTLFGGLVILGAALFVSLREKTP